GLVFVLIPAGSFPMGSPITEPDERCRRADEGPFGDQKVGAFFMSKFEMTRGQWRRVTGRDPSYQPVGRAMPEHVIGWLDPVDSVSWEDCTLWLGRMGLSLPSEQQWEYAARAGTTSTWWTGIDSTDLADAANVKDAACHAGGYPGDDWENWNDG